MSNSLFLIDYVDKKTYSLDRGLVFEILQGISKIKDLAYTDDPGDLAVFSGHYEYHPWNPEVYVLKNAESIIIGNTGEAGVAFALEFNRRYHLRTGRCMQIFDEAYGFHQQLSTDMTPEMLGKYIQADSHSGAPKESEQG